MVSLERKVSPFAFFSILCRGENLFKTILDCSFFVRTPPASFILSPGNLQVKGRKMETDWENGDGGRLNICLHV